MIPLLYATSPPPVPFGPTKTPPEANDEATVPKFCPTRPPADRFWQALLAPTSPCALIDAGDGCYAAGRAGVGNGRAGRVETRKAAERHVYAGAIQGDVRAGRGDKPGRIARAEIQPLVPTRPPATTPVIVTPLIWPLVNDVADRPEIRSRQGADRLEKPTPGLAITVTLARLRLADDAGAADGTEQPDIVSLWSSGRIAKLAMV